MKPQHCRYCYFIPELVSPTSLLCLKGIFNTSLGISQRHLNTRVRNYGAIFAFHLNTFTCIFMVSGMHVTSINLKDSEDFMLRLIRMHVSNSRSALFRCLTYTFDLLEVYLFFIKL